jgi:hypothetical protein
MKIQEIKAGIISNINLILKTYKPLKQTMSPEELLTIKELESNLAYLNQGMKKHNVIQNFTALIFIGLGGALALIIHMSFYPI